MEGKVRGSKSTVSFSTYKAYLYTFLAALCFSSNSVLVRFEKDTPALQMSMYRFVGMLVFSLPISFYYGANLFGPVGTRRFLLYRSAAAALTLIFTFFSFRYLPIGEASVIVFSTPVFVTIIARLFLKEDCGLMQSIIVALTVAGIVLTINPLSLMGQRDISVSDRITGIIFGLGGLFFNCSMVILTRLTRNVHYSVVCVTSAAMGVVLSLVLVGSAFHPVLPRCGMRSWVAIAMGVSSSLGQILYIQALQLDNVGPVSTLKAAVDITLATVWQVVIFNEIPDDFAIGGTALVVISVILLGVRKWALLSSGNSQAKRKIKCFTY